MIPAIQVQRLIAFIRRNKQSDGGNQITVNQEMRSAKEIVGGK